MTWCRPFVFAVLVNPANATITETTLREVQEAARVIGLQITLIATQKIWTTDGRNGSKSAETRR
jgi:hypothetical protein